MGKKKKKALNISETAIHGVPQGCCCKIECGRVDKLRERNCTRQPAWNAQIYNCYRH